MAAGDERDLIEAVVTCEGNLHDPDFQDRFSKLVANLKSALYISKTKDPFRVRKIEPWNSVRVTISIPKEAAQKLKLLAQQGSNVLRSMGILSVQVEGDQVISLTWAAQNNETTQVLIRQTNDEAGSSSGTSGVSSSSLPSSSPSLSSISSSVASVSSPVPLTPGSSGEASGMAATLEMLSSSPTLAFRSPNVVAPSGEAIPVLPPKSSATGVRPALGGPFPFVSMAHAAQAIQRNELTPMGGSNNVVVNSSNSGSNNAANSTNNIASSIPSSILQGAIKSVQPPQMHLPASASSNNPPFSSGKPVTVSTSACNVVTTVNVNSESHVTRLIIENPSALNSTSQMVGGNVTSFAISGNNNLGSSQAGPSQSLQLQLVNVPPPYPGVNTISSNHSLSSPISTPSGILTSKVQVRHSQPQGSSLSNVSGSSQSPRPNLQTIRMVAATVPQANPQTPTDSTASGLINNEVPSVSSITNFSDGTSGVSSLAQPVSSPLLVNLLQNTDVPSGSSSSTPDAYNQQSVQKNSGVPSGVVTTSSDNPQGKFLTQQQQQLKKTKRGPSMDGACSSVPNPALVSGAVSGSDCVLPVTTSQTSTGTDSFQFTLPLPSDNSSLVTVNRVSIPVSNHNKLGSPLSNQTAIEQSSTAILQGRTIIQGNIHLLDQGSGQLRTIPHQPPPPYPSASISTTPAALGKTVSPGDAPTPLGQLSYVSEHGAPTTLTNGPLFASPLLETTESNIVKSQSSTPVTLVQHEQQTMDIDASNTTLQASVVADQSRTLLPITTVNIVSKSASKPSTTLNFNNSKDSDTKTFIPPPDPRLLSQVQKVSHGGGAVNVKNPASSSVLQTASYSGDAKSSTSQLNSTGRAVTTHKKSSKDRPFSFSQIQPSGKPKQFLINPLTGHLEPMPSESSSENEEGDDGDGDGTRKSNSHKTSSLKMKSNKGSTLISGVHQHRQIVTTESGVTVARVIKGPVAFDQPTAQSSHRELDGRKSSNSSSDSNISSGLGSSIISVTKKSREDSVTNAALFNQKDAKDSNSPSPATVTATSVSGEKIKLRLKLEKSEPISPAYKVDVSFVKKSEKSSILPNASSSSSGSGASVSTFSSTSSNQSTSGDQPRVPPLHISLRGKNAAVVVSPRREEKDMPPPPPIVSGITKDPLVNSPKDLAEGQLPSTHSKSSSQILNSHEGKPIGSSKSSSGSVKRAKGRVKSLDTTFTSNSSKGMAGEKTKVKATRPKLSKEISRKETPTEIEQSGTESGTNFPMPVLQPAVISSPVPVVAVVKEPESAENATTEIIPSASDPSKIILPKETFPINNNNKFQEEAAEPANKNVTASALPSSSPAADLIEEEQKSLEKIPEENLSTVNIIPSEKLEEVTVKFSDLPKADACVIPPGFPSEDLVTTPATEICLPSPVDKEFKGALSSSEIPSSKLDDKSVDGEIKLSPRREDSPLSATPALVIEPDSEAAKEGVLNPVINRNLSDVSCDKTTNLDSGQIIDAQAETSNIIINEKVGAVNIKETASTGATTILKNAETENKQSVEDMKVPDPTSPAFMDTTTGDRTGIKSEMNISKDLAADDNSSPKKSTVDEVNEDNIIKNTPMESQDAELQLENMNTLKQEDLPTVDFEERKRDSIPEDDVNLKSHEQLGTYSETVSESAADTSYEKPPQIASELVSREEKECITEMEVAVDISDVQNKTEPSKDIVSVSVSGITATSSKDCKQNVDTTTMKAAVDKVPENQSQEETQPRTEILDSKLALETSTTKDSPSNISSSVDQKLEEADKTESISLEVEEKLPKPTINENVSDTSAATSIISDQTAEKEMPTVTDCEESKSIEALRENDDIEARKEVIESKDDVNVDIGSVKPTVSEEKVFDSNVSDTQLLNEDINITKDLLLQPSQEGSAELNKQQDESSNIIDTGENKSSETEAVCHSHATFPLDDRKVLEPETTTEDNITSENQDLSSNDSKGRNVLDITKDHQTPVIPCEITQVEEAVESPIVAQKLPESTSNETSLVDSLNLPDASKSDEKPNSSEKPATVLQDHIITEQPLQTLTNIEDSNIGTVVMEQSLEQTTETVAKESVEAPALTVEGSETKLKESEKSTNALIETNETKSSKSNVAPPALSVPKISEQFTEKQPSLISIVEPPKSGDGIQSVESDDSGTTVSVTIMTQKTQDIPPISTTDTPPISIVLPSDSVLRGNNPEGKSGTSKNAYKRRAEIKPGALQNTLKRLHDNFLPKVLKTSDKQDVSSQRSAETDDDIDEDDDDVEPPAPVVEQPKVTVHNTTTVPSTSYNKVSVTYTTVTQSQPVKQAVAVSQVKPMPNLINRSKVATASVPITVSTSQPTLHQISSGLQSNLLANVSVGISTSTLTSVTSISVPSTSSGAGPQTVFAIHPNVSIPANFAQLQQSPVVLPGGHKMVPIKLVTLPKQSGGQLQTIPLGNATPNRSSPNLLEAVNIVANAGSRSSSPKTLISNAMQSTPLNLSSMSLPVGGNLHFVPISVSSATGSTGNVKVLMTQPIKMQQTGLSQSMVVKSVLMGNQPTTIRVIRPSNLQEPIAIQTLIKPPAEQAKLNEISKGSTSASSSETSVFKRDFVVQPESLFKKLDGVEIVETGSPLNNDDLPFEADIIHDEKDLADVLASEAKNELIPVENCTNLNVSLPTDTVKSTEKVKQKPVSSSTNTTNTVPNHVAHRNFLNINRDDKSLQGSSLSAKRTSPIFTYSSASRANRAQNLLSQSPVTPLNPVTPDLHGEDQEIINSFSGSPSLSRTALQNKSQTRRSLDGKTIINSDLLPDHTYGITSSAHLTNCSSSNSIEEALSIEIPSMDLEVAATLSPNVTEEKRCTRSTRSNTRLSPDITAFVSDTPKPSKLSSKVDPLILKNSPKASPTGSLKVLSPTPSSLTITPSTSTRSSPILNSQHQVNASNAAATINAVALGIIDKIQGNATAQNVKNSRISKLTGANKRKRQESDSSSASRDENNEEKAEIDLNSRPGKRKCSENAAEMIKVCIGVEDSPKRNSTSIKKTDEAKSKEIKGKKGLGIVTEDDDDADSEVSVTRGRSRSSRESSEDRSSSRGSSVQRVVSSTSNEKQKSGKEEDASKDLKPNRLNSRANKDEAQKLKSQAEKTSSPPMKKAKESGKVATRRPNRPNSKNKSPLTPAKTRTNVRKDALTSHAHSDKSVTSTPSTPDAENARRKTRSSAASKRHAT